MNGDTLSAGPRHSSTVELGTISIQSGVSLLLDDVRTVNDKNHKEQGTNNATLRLSPPQRLPLGIPIKISIIDNNRKRAGNEP